MQILKVCSNLELLLILEQYLYFIKHHLDNKQVLYCFCTTHVKLENLFNPLISLAISHKKHFKTAASSAISKEGK